jgi:signal transduction histidine kinase
MTTDSPTPAPEILVVEDSATQAERLKFTLENSGYRLTVSPNGREALESVSRRAPTLIVSDIVMPEMDGYELCRRLKQEEASRRIPVILLTSLSDPVDVVRGLECGADGFIFKPCDERHLLSRIAHILANLRLRESEGTRMGIEVYFAGKRFFITSDRLQILNLLLSTYENAIERNRELAVARDDLRQLAESLESKVRERTAALEAENAERRRAEAEVRRLNAELEQRVRSRTAQLQFANEELESFAYSVSHDLRAPLRHIDGFVGLLNRRSAHGLDETAQRYLTTISNSAQQMARLIDDLLEFSRNSRAELLHTAVSVDDLLRGVLRDMEAECRDRTIRWEIEPLPVVHGDSALLRQVLVNLLSNALKYTRPRPVAEIAVSARTVADEWEFTVRDNGVGFDMRYADKLFGVFQRLHRAEEFEGTGIGLANVRRIVARHGGRAWAESAPDAGARFHFTIPVNPP